MEGSIQAIIQWLLNQGWAGLAIIFGGALIWDMRKELALARLRIADLQEKRVTDAQELTKEVTEAIGTTRATIQVAVDMMTKERRGR